MAREFAFLAVQGGAMAWNGTRRAEALRALEAGELRQLDFDAVVFRAGRNRNHLRIRTGDLEAFAASFVGVPFLRDHRVESVEARAGIVVKSALCEGVGNLARGRMPGKWIRQTIRVTTQRDIRAFLEGQIDRFSVAWYYDSVRCSVCGREWGVCKHRPGHAYGVDGLAHRRGTRIRCELVFENPRGKEVSAVNAPAVEGTGILQGARF